MAFAPIEHTADLGIEVRAAALDELFVEAARGLTDAITEVASVAGAQSQEVSLEGGSLDVLLVALLEELLYRFDTAGWLTCDGQATVAESASGWKLLATLRGEAYDGGRHPLKVHVKAITYHGLEVARGEGEWRARVLFDI